MNGWAALFTLPNSLAFTGWAALGFLGPTGLLISLVVREKKARRGPGNERKRA